MQALIQKSHCYKASLGVGFTGILINECRAKVEIRRPLEAQATFKDVDLILGCVKFDMHSRDCINNLPLSLRFLLVRLRKFRPVS